MGIVYRAQDPTIGRVIAIKSIRLNELSDEAERAHLRERLFREAQSAGILSHPNIVTIYDILEENGLAYIFMECVDGPPLDEWLRSDRPPNTDQLLQVLLQTGEAIDYAHKRGIIHRDIKPANIMVHEQSQAKVCDFGVAKIASQQLTQTGLLLGTPSYMSPEQLRGEKIDGRSDQFALAVMVYEFLAGQKPFTGDSIPRLIFRICGEEPAPITDLNPSVGPMVDTIIRKALAKNPNDRYDSCAKFVAFVRKALEGREWVIPIAARAGQADATTASGSSQAIPDPDHDRTTYSGAHPSAAISAPVAAAPAEAVSQSVRVPSFSADPFRPDMRAGAPESSGAIRPDSSGIIRSELPVRRLDEAPSSQKSRTWLALPLVAILAGAGYFAWDKFGAKPTVEPTAGESTSPPQTPPKATPGKSEPAKPDTPKPFPQAKPEPVAVDPDPAKPPGDPLVVPPPVDNAKPIAPAGSTEVELTTAPAGASVVIDNSTELSCKAPCRLSVPKGRHTLLASLEGYIPASRIFHTPESASVSVKLDLDGGSVVIRTNPPGASISVNGQLQGAVSPAVIQLRAGTYQIELIKDGHKYSESVEVRRESRSTINVDWK